MAAILRRSGLALIDTDDLARDLLQPGQQALAEVVTSFGTGVLNDTGQLDRGALAALVFSKPEARAKLEAILHPQIRQRWSAWLDAVRERAEPAAFVVIPLLYEKAYEASFDAVISVGCSASTQRHRLLARGWSEEAIRDRIAAQLPLADKLRRADFVLWSEGDLEALEGQCQRVLRKIGVAA